MTINYHNDIDQSMKLEQRFRNCRYCGKLIKSVMMSRHLKLKHDNEVVRY